MKERTQAALDLIAQGLPPVVVKGLPTTPGEFVSVLGEATYKATDSVVGSVYGWWSLLAPQRAGGYSAAIAGRPDWPRRALSLEGPVDDLLSGAF